MGPHGMPASHGPSAETINPALNEKTLTARMGQSAMEAKNLKETMLGN